MEIIKTMIISNTNLKIIFPAVCLRWEPPTANGDKRGVDVRTAKGNP